ncbi:MAG: ABC transporter ATP-binding protein [Curvibacter lanceolatus]|uniref:ABC transporter ATP-binding protein n=1 Tax=Curvibacter lanceolatus TaxID=86182 RepID=UPI0012F75630|nr:ABC transporter ATP-binding protein [Curvibacter lanceolatus]MBV5291838.1 ABC transporter ATP-binding protein [Curvibacter lanceolatus]
MSAVLLESVEAPELTGRPEAAPEVLRIEQLTVSFGEHIAVRGLDLQVAAGEMLALVGESGCGKSTTALAVLRLLGPQARSRGRLWLQGRDLLALPESALSSVRGREVGMIFQEPMTSLNPLQSIGQQVAEAVRLHERLPPAALRERVLALLAQVRLPEPAQRYDDYPHQLSGGQRQRVMIAIAVACRPRLLIADEPTTALDATIQAEILALIDGLRRELGMAVLLITHDLGLVAQWADRVAVMHAGLKLEEGPVAEVLARPSHAYTRGLLAASLHGSQVPHYRDTRLAEIRQDAEGGFRVVRPPARPVQALPVAAPALLEVQDLTVRYAGRGGTAAVQGVSLQIAAGETLGLVGESGCGKSSLSRALVQLVAAESGQVRWQGQDLLGLSPRELLPWRRRIQMIFQDPFSSLNPRQRVEDILGHALRLHGVQPARERDRRIDAILSDVGLPATARRRYPHEFSGGQRQRIGIARALVLRPELVICDEPVSALDVSVQAQVLNLLVDLKAEYGLSYLFISHDIAVVRYIADRVLVMQAGQVVDSGAHPGFWQETRHPYTQRLLASVPGAAADPSSDRLQARA